MFNDAQQQVSNPKGGSPIVRLMVLETDEPHPDTKEEHGSFGEILHRHFANAGQAHHPPLGIETDQVFVVTEKGGKRPEFQDFEGFDGLLITGSMYDASANNSWILELLSLLKELWTRRPNDFVFIGVCFGHQLLARLLGAEVAPSPAGDWELGRCKITLSLTGQQLFRTEDKEIHLHQMHQEQVVAPPSSETAEDGLLPPNTEVEVWGRSEHTRVQGLYIPNRLFTTQAHLAFDEDMVNRQIRMRIDGGGITDKEHADQAAETAHWKHDGDVVAAAILRVFHFDDDGHGA
ncbi:class I glutamine amidotransferase-like protein [Podospora didyma]|uniref:Class I glutamine amidotransferase-like protein n=1 Tax=Podospora didyma TaxID=330526 RepID=A0AAE0NY52_9PEZI|nr:class I glutamine amidotransferase-like protein [Podospora didyma]